MRKNNKDLIGYILIGLFLVIVAIAIFFVVTNKDIELDKLTGCEKKAGPNNYYAIILDNTDTLRTIQKSSVKNKIKGIVNKAGPNDKVIIYSLSNFSVEKTVPIIDKCSMRDGSDADKFTENEALLRK